MSYVVVMSLSCHYHSLLLIVTHCYSLLYNYPKKFDMTFSGSLNDIADNEGH